MTEKEELLRLREVLKAARAVLEGRLPDHEQKQAFSWSAIPNDRLNWLQEVVNALTVECAAR